MSRASLIGAAAVAIVLSLTSCSEAARLTLAPESTAQNIVFVLSAWSESKPGHLLNIQVYRCDERRAPPPGEQLTYRYFPERGAVVWSAGLERGADEPLVGRFTYGQDLAGFKAAEGPQPLGPGCYIATAAAGFPDVRIGAVLFRITADGGMK